VATHGAEALARVEERRPAVILLDINMPVMDGPTFCAALDAGPGRSSIAVVLMTAGRDAHRLRDQTAADAVLAKPFSLDDLYTVVERYLAAS
jgi:CheY-like chemotaxis protein